MSGAPRRRTYRRTLRLPYGTGIVAVDERAGTAGASARPGGWLDARLHLTDLRDLTTAVQRLRRLFDLDADPYAVDERLGADPRLAPLVAARPGLRSPGAADPEEFAVRALAGRAKSERLVRRYGKPLDAPAAASPTSSRHRPTCRRTGRHLAAALADGTFGSTRAPTATRRRQALLALPGMTPLLPRLIRMRAWATPTWRLRARPAGRLAAMALVRHAAPLAGPADRPLTGASGPDPGRPTPP